MIDQIRINWAMENQFSEEDVFRVEGILDVNTIEYFPCPIDLKPKDGTYQLQRDTNKEMTLFKHLSFLLSFRLPFFFINHF